MSTTIDIYLLVFCIAVLLLIVIYQYLTYQKGVQKNINEISKSLSKILDTEDNEKVMVFTENKAIINLLGQINRLLEDKQKAAAVFKHSENSSKKMLSNISHDIKTPLTVILGYLEIMRLHSPKDETLIKVQRKANQVMELINQFFSLAKLEAGDTDIAISKVNINEVCRESILDFYGILNQHDYKIDIQIPEKKQYVKGNAEAINRILFNLISNAIRYGGDGKFIGIVLYSDNSKVYIDVVDHGKGIERDFAANVFDRLYTLEDSRNRKIQGNGLGLTIAKNLAMQMGGDIYLESVPNIKTIFTLRLIKII